jgi:hypothetical protein
MKELFSFLIIFIVSIFSCNSQTYEDVVYLKNGGIIHGIIIEQIPNQSIKIQTRDENVFFFKIEEIEKITKEIKSYEKSNDKNSGNSKVIIGYKNPGTAFLWSFLIPGLGQYYNDQDAKGFLMILIHAASIAGIIASESEDELATFVLLGGVNSFWSMIDAPISARMINREKGLCLNIKIDDTNLLLSPVIRIDKSINSYSSVIGAKVSLSF